MSAEPCLEPEPEPEPNAAAAGNLAYTAPTLQFEVAGVTVRVVQDPELTRQETGSYLWEEASEHLINFVLKEFGGDVKGLRFVDLGCGCGSVGNALALLGGNVTLTDVDELRPNVQANIDANAAAIAEAGGHATFSTLDWTDANREKILRDAGPFDMVVGSELMYAAVLLGDTHAPLISTIQAAMTASTRCDPPVNCVGMLAGEYHFGYEDLFFEEAKEAGLGVEILFKDTATLKVLRLTGSAMPPCAAENTSASDSGVGAPVEDGSNATP